MKQKRESLIRSRMRMNEIKRMNAYLTEWHTLMLSLIGTQKQSLVKILNVFNLLAKKHACDFVHIQKTVKRDWDNMEIHSIHFDLLDKAQI